MKSKLVLLISAFSLASLTACNTIQGVGRDIERAGQELEEAID
ncbi:MAG: entericidin A/B family lipoprotein [Alphaproteobacteria bacterium]|nr:entericidin A/B family lipoprotein [Alphaproteobacteria bacterium]